MADVTWSNNFIVKTHFCWMSILIFSILKLKEAFVHLLQNSENQKSVLFIDYYFTTILP